MSAIHHVAITVSDIEKSLDFYKKLGFKVYFKEYFPEKGKKLSLLQLEELKLEIFWYEDIDDYPDQRKDIGNNVHDIGVKHFALSTDSIKDKYEELEQLGIKPVSEIADADGGYKFFFIRDPDGIWVEYVEDKAD